MNGKKTVPAASLILFLCLIASALALPCLGAPAPSADRVDAVCVMNVEYGTVVYDKQSDLPVYPASTVKLMTALTAYRLLEGDLNRAVTVTKDMKKAFGGRVFGFSEGETVNLTDVMAAMLVGGYNDAAILLAFRAANSVEAFCEQMNAYAVELGAANTHYENPTGLHDENMITTARDTALIAAAFMKTAPLFELSQNAKYVYPRTNLHNPKTIYTTNALLSSVTTDEYRTPEAMGMNAGNTDEGGDCLVTAGRQGDLSFVAVFLGGRKASEEDTKNHAFKAAGEILPYVLKTYKRIRLNTGKETYRDLPVELSATVTSVGTGAKESLYAILPADVDMEKEISLVPAYQVDSLKAPFEEGTPVGTLTIYYGGKIIGQTEIVTRDGAQAHPFLAAMENIRAAMQKPIFWIIIVGAAGAVVLILLAKPRLLRFAGGKRKKRKYK